MTVVITTLIVIRLGWSLRSGYLRREGIPARCCSALGKRESVRPGDAPLSDWDRGTDPLKDLGQTVAWIYSLDDDQGLTGKITPVRQPAPSHGNRHY